MSSLKCSLKIQQHNAVAALWSIALQKDRRYAPVPLIYTRLTWRKSSSTGVFGPKHRHPSPSPFNFPHPPHPPLPSRSLNGPSTILTRSPLKSTLCFTVSLLIRFMSTLWSSPPKAVLAACHSNEPSHRGVITHHKPRLVIQIISTSTYPGWVFFSFTRYHLTRIFFSVGKLPR